MNIYSNSFFHRTDNINSIQGILEDGFKVFYCKEEIFMGQKQPPSYIGIPMVSFCDIPLHLFSRNNYGRFGIAVKRVWGNRRNLEPVLYYPNNVRCQSTKVIMNAAFSYRTNPKDFDNYRILGYSKPIKKIKAKPGYSKNNYIEREWRRVYANSSQFKWLTEREFIEYRGSSLVKKSVGNPLTFTADDIDFIIVPKNDLIVLQNYIMNGGLKNIGGNPNK